MIKSGTWVFGIVLCLCVAVSVASVVWLGQKVFETYKMRDAEIHAARIVALTHSAETAVSRDWKDFLNSLNTLTPEDFSLKTVSGLSAQARFKFPVLTVSVSAPDGKREISKSLNFSLGTDNGNVLLSRKVPGGKIQQISFSQKDLFEKIEAEASRTLFPDGNAKLRLVPVSEKTGFGIIRGLPGAKIEIDILPRKRAESTAARRATILAGIGIGLMLVFILILALRVLALSEKRYLFAASVSHELKTPIAELRSCAETARAHCRDAELIHELSAIRASSQELETIVENLMIFSGISTGNLHVALSKHNAGALLFPIFERIGNRLVSANMDMVLDIADEVEARELKTSPEMLARILFNLTENAVKYAYRDGAENIITVGVSVKKNILIIDVEDEGPGIPEPLRENIFIAFERGKNHEKHSGLGLGLTISSRIARLLNGKLSLLRSDCTGTTFRLEIPLLKI